MKLHHTLASLAIAVAAVSPAFGEIPEGSPAEGALRTAQATVDRIVSVPKGQHTFDDKDGAIDELLAQIKLDTNMTMFLASVSPDADIRVRSHQAEQDVTDWLIDLSKNENSNAVRTFADTNPSLPGTELGDIDLVGMAYPEFPPIMDRSTNETIRKEAWLAYEPRGDEKNVRLLEQILELQNQAATMLGDASLFDITQPLYGMEYVDVTDTRTVWHPDVKNYEVWDEAIGEQLGALNLDIQPTADKPSLLTHDEVGTFFHELIIPHRISFGEGGHPSIPPRATLDVELFSIESN